MASKRKDLTLDLKYEVNNNIIILRKIIASEASFLMCSMVQILYIYICFRPYVMP